MKLIPGVHTEELELFSNGKLGLEVHVHYKEAQGYAGKQIHVHHNCTEIHWMHNKEMAERFPKSCPLAVAIESDIHGTGGTRDLERIEYIHIEPSMELYPEH